MATTSGDALMTCKICNRYSCTESFHSIEEQEVWERLCNMSERELKNEIIDLHNEIVELRNTLDSYTMT
jgi:hypothetical protein